MRTSAPPSPPAPQPRLPTVEAVANPAPAPALAIPAASSKSVETSPATAPAPVAPSLASLASGALPQNPGPLPPARDQRPVKESAADLHIQLCKARELFYAGQLDEAWKMACQLRMVRSAQWSASQDSPEKLMDDIKKVRVHVEQEAAAQVLAEARKQLQQGNLDEAEQLAREAARLHGPYKFLECWGERPDNVLDQIAAVRTSRRKAVQTVTPSPVARTPAPSYPPEWAKRPSEPAKTASATPQTQPAVPGVVPSATAATEAGGSAKLTERPREIQTVAAVAAAPAAPTVLPAVAVQASGPNIEPIPTVAPGTTPAAGATALPTAPPLTTLLPSYQQQAGDLPTAPAMTTKAAIQPVASAVGTAAPAPPTSMATPRPHTEPVPTGTGDQAGCWNCVCQSASCASGYQLTADVGFAALFPYWKNNAAFVVVPAGRIPTTGIVDFDYDAQFVPQVRLGVEGSNGVGFRIGWWGFVNADRQATLGNLQIASAAPLGLGINTLRPIDGMQASSDLHMNVWDFELTEKTHVGAWWLLFSGGIRYAHVSQNYVALLSDNAGTTLQGVFSGHHFDGAGPTASFNARRWVDGTPFYLYGDVRGSLLFGTSEQSAFVGTGSRLLNTQQAFSAADAMLPVAEMELGIGWTQSMGSTQAFAQAGLLAQAWFDAGNASRDTLVSGPAAATSATVDPTLGLFGFTMRVGVNY